MPRRPAAKKAPAEAPRPAAAKVGGAPECAAPDCWLRAEPGGEYCNMHLAEPRCWYYGCTGAVFADGICETHCDLRTRNFDADGIRISLNRE